MRKADKRKRGEERNAVYMEEERIRQAAALKLDHEMRAERARLVAIQKKRPKNTKRMREVHGG